MDEELGVLFLMIVFLLVLCFIRDKKRNESETTQITTPTHDTTDTTVDTSSCSIIYLGNGVYVFNCN